MRICWFHHRLVHESGWNVRFDSRGQALAIGPNGNVLAVPHPLQVRARHGIEHGNCERGVTIDPTTCIQRRYGDPFGLGEIVSGLMAN